MGLLVQAVFELFTDFSNCSVIPCCNWRDDSLACHFLDNGHCEQFVAFDCWMHMIQEQLGSRDPVRRAFADGVYEVDKTRVSCLGNFGHNFADGRQSPQGTDVFVAGIDKCLLRFFYATEGAKGSRLQVEVP